MSGIYDVTLASNSSAQVPAMGSFVKVLTAPLGAVQVKLDGGEGYTLLAGQGVRLPDGKSFRDVQVKNLAASAQAITVFVGDARFEDTRISGVVSITNAIGAATQVLGGGGGALLTSNQFNAMNLLPAASNLRGVVVRQASAGTCVTAVGASQSSQAIIIGAAATPTVASAPAQIILCSIFTLGTTYVENAQFDKNILLPVGWGIWVCTSNILIGATTAGGQVTVEVL